MPGEIVVDIGDDGTVELDMSRSGWTPAQKKKFREDLAAGVGGKVTGEKHKPVKEKSKLRIQH